MRVINETVVYGKHRTHKRRFLTEFEKIVIASAVMIGFLVLSTFAIWEGF